MLIPTITLIRNIKSRPDKGLSKIEIAKDLNLSQEKIEEIIFALNKTENF